MTMDVETEALADIEPLVASMSTNLTTFSAHGAEIRSWIVLMESVIGMAYVRCGGLVVEKQ